MQKLENLEITKVAFVPEGDNKKADVLLFKSKPADKDNKDKPQDEPSAIDATPDEAHLMKRVLLAIGKALGFEKAESTEGDKDPADDNPQEGDGPQGDKNGNGDKPEETKKGAVEDMKIDKSKLTAEELAQLEAIEKKAGIAEDDANADDDTKKSAPAPTPAPADNDGGADDDIYKGLHPAVAAELKELRKRADAAEERELYSVAKKYELLGKKPEDLAKTLKSLKAAGGTAYDEMIAVMDASLTAVEKAGTFGEVGKSGSGTTDAWAQIEKHADEILKSAPTMTRSEAIEKACDQHPELVAEYENNR